MITLTPLAAEKVKNSLEKRGRGIGIRIGVRTTGCSGLAYTFEYVDTAPVTRDQFVYESFDIKVWVDGRSVPYLNGIVVDWQKKGLNEGFEFINPNERDRCGCGESFRV
jgi:iron-sulfur cluster assembly protein